MSYEYQKNGPYYGQLDYSDYNNTSAPCSRNAPDCKAYRHGGCIALSDTKFNRPCPFYKRKERET